MKSKYHIYVFILLTLLAGITACYFFFKGNDSIALICSLATLITLSYSFGAINRVFRDVNDFVEAVKYHDFSKRYPEKKGKKDSFYRYFNEISSVFMNMSRENETNQQYLKKILELVNTGILAYDIESCNTLWMNESFKNMFLIPSLKNINWLTTRQPELHKVLTEIPLGENRLITINTGNQSIKVLSSASTFQTNDKTYKLIAIYNVGATLEEIEAGAWKGLLNVMTHEIMNSIAPVASLADTLKKRLENIKVELGGEVHPDFEDIEFAMETIRRRSEGLLRFADTYRNLNKTIVPEMHPVNLHDLLNAIYQLMYPSLNQKGILLEIKTDNTAVMANIDRVLIEQVLINFITNAIYAVKEKKDPQIILFSGLTVDNNPYITVADNGCGIDPEVRDKIFIPFFSTKKTGSGIGLSLSREIVKLHNGNLQVQSKKDEGSAFTILLSGKESA